MVSLSLIFFFREYALSLYPLMLDNKIENEESLLFTFPFPLYLCFLFFNIFLFFWCFSIFLFFLVSVVGEFTTAPTTPVCSFLTNSFSVPGQRGNP